MELKKEKHKINAAVILNAPESMRAVWDHLAIGKAVEVKNYLKIGSEEAPKVIAQTGILPSTANAQFKLIFDSLLDNFDQVRVDANLTTNELTYFTPDGKTYTLKPEDFRNIKFSEIVVSNSQKDKYLQMLIEMKLKFQPARSYTNQNFPSESDFEKEELHFNYRSEEKAISYAEKCALNIYTNSFYSSINHFMRGNIALATSDAKLTSSETAKEVFTHVVMISNALSHLPNFEDPKGTFQWRSEGEGFATYGVLALYKKAVDEGGNVCSFTWVFKYSIPKSIYLFLKKINSYSSCSRDCG